MEASMCLGWRNSGIHDTYPRQVRQKQDTEKCRTSSLTRVNWIPASARERRRVEFVNIGEARSQGLRFCQAMSPMCVRKAMSICSLRTPSAAMSALAELTELTGG